MSNLENNGISYSDNRPVTKARSLTYGSLTIALVFIATYAIKIPVPFTQGYIHPGDSMVFVAAILFGWRFGALAGGVGSALADLIGGYGHWVIPTLIIKGIMGGIVGFIGHDLAKKDNYSRLNTYITLGFSLVWISFCFTIRAILSGLIENEPAALLALISDAGTIENLASLVQGVNFWLGVAGVTLPLGIILIAYYLAKHQQSLLTSSQLIAMFLAGLWMVIGYYIGAGFLYGSFIIPIFSVPSNIIQFLGGLAISYLILTALKKAGIENFL